MQVQFRGIQAIPVKAYFALSGTALGSECPETAQALGLAERYEAFTGAPGQIACIRDYQSGSATVFVGLGDAVSPEALRRGTDKLVAWANRQKIAQLGIAADGLQGEELRSVAEAAVMASYRYTEYLTSKPERSLEQVVIEAEASLLAEEKIRSLGMEALYQVSKGSPNPPVVIIMRYTGAPECPEDITALIGKGVTYDSGGLNLKAGQRFTTMKHDMAGGGTVIGAMCAIAQQKLRCNVVAVVAACENLISGRAYKPGDIIGSMGGKTIQINSTDAEGRLTLIDAITYAIRYEHASRLVDIATLTGAARRILGEYGAPVLGNDDSLWSALEAGAKGSGELVCRVPLVPDARAKIRGDVCDLLNTSLAETGGMVTAALFIEEFVEGKPWMHIDAAGPLWLDHDMPYTPRGGSGWGVRTLYHMVKGLAR